MHGSPLLPSRSPWPPARTRRCASPFRPTPVPPGGARLYVYFVDEAVPVTITVAGREVARLGWAQYAAVDLLPGAHQIAAIGLLGATLASESVALAAAEIRYLRYRAEALPRGVALAPGPYPLVVGQYDRRYRFVTQDPLEAFDFLDRSTEVQHR